MKTQRGIVTPRPFLKWVGGKRQLLPQLVAQVDRAGEFHQYHEPFVGGGALFFELVRTGRLPRGKTYLSDTNTNLIDAYRAVRDNVDRVIELLLQHKQKHSERYYYEIRAKVPGGRYERAARIIYLNKTGYNGLYRENSKGGYNVPFGSYVNPRICDEVNLREAAKALLRAELDVRTFERILDFAAPGDLVYFDPPYDPVSKTASFTSYAKGGFGEDTQRSLANVVEDLDRHGVKVLLSNSMTPLVRKLYKKFTIGEVFATRNVNSRADRRGKISEVLVRNF
ncbi:MAG: DNA adenine methylase [Candidatus Hydrogenedentes bacterium]|nr:DNA adenine methylase [Candidatus Hydrogenedentota bacterium]